jgi:hypothetical protein
VLYNGSSPAVSLEGNGVAVALKAPTELTLPSAAAGATGKPGNLIITNDSSAAVQIGAAGKITNFGITADHCANATLASRSKCLVTVEFKPADGTKGQLVSILSYGFRYGANSGSVNVSLKGKVK